MDFYSGQKDGGSHDIMTSEKKIDASPRIVGQEFISLLLSTFIVSIDEYKIGR